MSSGKSSPTERQFEIAKICGITIKGLTKRSAAAVLGADLAEDVLGVEPHLPVTDAQKSIAKQLGIAELSPFKEIAAIQINAAFVTLNEKAMNDFQFAPGMEVEYVGGPHVHPLTHKVGEVFRISTIGKDGRLYFKGVNGGGAYPSQLKPLRNGANT